MGPLIVGITALVCYLLEPATNTLLAYDRYALQGWETWRVITGNFVHTNGYHLLLNLAGLALLWLLYAEHFSVTVFLKVFIWCSLGTTLGIYWFSPQLIWYAGLSGALHGVFVWGASKDIIRGILSGWLLLAGVIGKIIYEQLYGSSTGVAELIDASVAVDAHLYGALSGILLFGAMHTRQLLKRSA
nr:rhombosortase [Salinimonas chungwhensis]